MPVEILELIVRAEITEDAQHTEAPAEQEEPGTEPAFSALEIAEQINEILKRKKER
ncbi:MAG: hypothetical protein J5I94_10620 [Phaeodactylibacter sp.]|nr:hypothetical protein [Phaeodactylibacter sp.]